MEKVLAHNSLTSRNCIFTTQFYEFGANCFQFRNPFGESNENEWTSLIHTKTRSPQCAHPISAWDSQHFTGKCDISRNRTFRNTFSSPTREHWLSIHLVAKLFSEFFIQNLISIDLYIDLQCINSRRQSTFQWNLAIIFSLQIDKYETN